MDELIKQIHYVAGRAYGEEATCGRKIDYKSEESADKAAAAMSAKGDKVLEAYPCWWCKGWHIGRAMTQDEWKRFTWT